MRKILAIILVSAGAVCLIYGGSQLWVSYSGEKKRLGEAMDLVSDEVVDQAATATGSNSNIDYKDFKKGDTIGVLYIPKLDRELPIVEGTDEEELAVGVGHYSDTGLPGENKQILLSGHRDTVFRQFDQLDHGDEFHVKLKNGTFIYEIQDHEIVDAADTTVIDPNRSEEYLTVSTCYPFSYIGSAPDRYVLYAYPK